MAILEYHQTSGKEGKELGIGGWDVQKRNQIMLFSTVPTIQCYQLCQKKTESGLNECVTHILNSTLC